MRPLFHKDFKNETQIICTVISYDGENDPAVCAMIGASAAATISGLPFLGPIACSRVGYTDGDYIQSLTRYLVAQNYNLLLKADKGESGYQFTAYINPTTDRNNAIKTRNDLANIHHITGRISENYS